MSDSPNDEHGAPSEEVDLLDSLLAHTFQEGYEAPRQGPSLEPRRHASHLQVRYEVFDELGHGGMGRVLRGRDRELGRDVALKILRDRHTSDGPAVARFLEEARIGGQLEHPGIVPVYEMGSDRAARPYFSMKLVHGRTLADLLDERESPAQDLQRCLKIFEQVCQAIAFAHARGVVHRDLKPTNVMVGAFGEVQVMDWGLAKILDDGDGASAEVRDEGSRAKPFVRLVRDDDESDRYHTTTGSVFGTPAYMSPEQARGEILDLDERTDVFGLGAILCEILTGQPPYVAQSSAATRALAAGADLGDARKRLDACDADAELCDLVRECLRAEPDDRPRNASHLAQLVSDYLVGVEERRRQAELRAAAAAARAASERRAKRLTVGLAAVVLAASGGWIWTESSRRARIQRSEHAVAEAMAEASRLWREARSASEGDLTPWSAAIAAAAQATTISRTNEVHAATAERVRKLGADIRAEHATAQTLAAEIAKDRETVHRLDEIRIGVPKFDTGLKTRNSNTFANVFRDYGIDVRELSDDHVIRRIRESRIADRLTSALDEWANLLPTRPGNPEGLDPRFGGRLRKLADRSESSPLRVALRKAGRSRDKTAWEDLRKQLSAAIGDLETMYLWARMLEACGDTDSAKTVLEQIQIRRVGDFHANLRLGLMAYRAQPPRLSAACRYLASAVAVRPTSELARFWLVAALWQHGDREPARLALARLDEQIAPGNDYPLHLAFELNERKRFDDAKSLIEKFHKSGLESCLSWKILGETHRQQGEFAAAAAAHRQALKAHTDNSSPIGRARHLNDLGFALARLDRNGEALLFFEEAAKLVPHWLPPHANVVSVTQNLGHYIDCIRWAHTTLKLVPDHTDTLFNLARVHLETWNLDEALRLFQMGLANAKRGVMTPKYHRVQVNHATALRRKGRLDDCLEQLEAVRAHISTSKDLKEAFDKELHLCLRAGALNAQLPAYVDGSKKLDATDTTDREALGELCIASGEFVAATRILRLTSGVLPVDRIERYACADVLAGTRTDSPNKRKHRERAHRMMAQRLDHVENPNYLRDPKSRLTARKHVERWLLDHRLVGVRDAAKLAKLPADERETWREFWQRVETVRLRLSEK